MERILDGLTPLVTATREQALAEARLSEWRVAATIMGQRGQILALACNSVDDVMAIESASKSNRTTVQWSVGDVANCTITGLSNEVAAEWGLPRLPSQFDVTGPGD